MLLIVKIGSNLIQTEQGDIDLEFISRLAREVKVLKSQGDKVLIVSSGAVLCGIKKLGLSKKPEDLTTKQALAGIGQAYLMRIYDSTFSNYGLVVAQVLLTNDVFKDPVKFQSAKNTLEKMLELSVVPIINENDTVAISELIFGDNDFLAVYTAFMMEANLIVLYSSAGGLLDHEGMVIPEIKDVGQAMVYIRKEKSMYGSGGMYSKLSASAIASSLGIPVFITGKSQSLLDVVNNNAVGTLIKPSTKPLKHSKRLMAMMEETRGAVYIDEGAYRALKEGKSLLPAGIKRVEGYFQRGDLVSVKLLDGMLVGKGRVNFSSEELSRVMGMKGEEVKKALNTQKEEAIHRDKLVIFF
ncbi:glutamate 5-kinase [Thermocrinis minervae]|uniref:Glutamate 5-kinase n=1 Tax=Thermocrinis minervae TaxID=381751 RepID=A0A1M6T1X4_9AQUI|nr:glutamate 5-kinase [Thermocrinis minervae]SHK50992.1 glutamate 5-kinase [Thermocrinis minervae]